MELISQKGTLFGTDVKQIIITCSVDDENPRRAIDETVEMIQYAKEIIEKEYLE